MPDGGVAAPGPGAEPTPKAGGAPLSPLRITLHYDFASSLCYVAHRVLGRLQGFLDELAIEIAWSPLDLAMLMHWGRGQEVDPHRIAHVRQVAEWLDVPLRVPRVWLDSRPLGAAALVLLRSDEDSGSLREATWRERVFTRIYEEGVDCGDLDAARRMADELDLAIASRPIEEATLELEARTRDAARKMVTGVPTFMLGPWPFGGIQEDDTMRSILGRWAERQRRPTAKA